MVRAFAIVPAAGLSRRMGAAKLLLPLAGRPLVEHVLASWTASGVTRTSVVVRADDAALRDACGRFDVDVVVAAQPPPDMKTSVRLALEAIESRYSPSPSDAWLVAPADMPRLPAAAIDAVLGAYDPDRPAAVVPVCDGRRGHPLLAPWSAASRVAQLGCDEGVNALLATMPVREVAWPDASILKDVDAPADLTEFE